MTTVIRRQETLSLGSRVQEHRRTLSWQVTSGVWSPPTDVYETDLEYVVAVEIAGMREGDFEVIYDSGMLLISGQRPDVTERRAYHQMEIHFGKFSAAVALPGAVDLDHAAAEYKDGFLLVKMPKLRSANVKIEG